MIKKIESQFNINLKIMQQMQSSFVDEINNGIAGRKSSLDSIPTYISPPKRTETGCFIAVDLGGTNCRVLYVRLSGKNQQPEVVCQIKKKLTTRDISSTKEIFF